MSATFDIDKVADAIAGLTITGVTIKDINEIPEAINLGTSVLCPRPDNFVTNVRITPSEISEQKLDVRYTLNYTYFHTKIGSRLFGDYSALITKLGAILVAFSNDATLTGSINSGNARHGQLGPVMDAAGNTYHGCEVSLDVMQFLEV